ncbi:toll-like receptor 13 [Pygocentrus nattereri]|nr:toll-like receptor 13 [Pygocentrus nattereri]
MEKLCQTDVQYLCYLGTAITITLLVSASVGYHFAYWPCMVLFLQLRAYVERKIGRKWRIKKRRAGKGKEDLEVEEEMKYDAFVSFSSHDEAWVFGELAPRLEEQGHPRLRLCLHNRDFEVGKGIVDNIAESIYTSERTVCVLTRRYLRSEWCGLEMRMATHRLLEEQKHRLILIFLEHISPFELSAFHR